MKNKIISKKKILSLSGSRELPMCHRAYSRNGPIIWSFASHRNIRAKPVEAKICEIFISYFLCYFHNYNGVFYGDIGNYAHDKDAKCHNF